MILTVLPDGWRTSGHLLAKLTVLVCVPEGLFFWRLGKAASWESTELSNVRGGPPAKIVQGLVASHARSVAANPAIKHRESERVRSETMATVAPGVGTQQAAPTKRFVLVGVAIAFAWPLVLFIPGVSGQNITDIRDGVVNIGMKWLVVAGLCVIAFWAQGRPPSELGIRRVRWRDVLAAVGGVIIGIVLSGVANCTVAIPPSVNDLQEIAAVPVILRVALVVTAGICEEFIYRGFAIEELTILTGKRRLSAVVAWAFFTIGHAQLYHLSTALIVPGILGALLTVLYLWRRNLASCALMHAIVDGMFLVILPALVIHRQVSPDWM